VDLTPSKTPSRGETMALGNSDAQRGGDGHSGWRAMDFI